MITKAVYENGVLRPLAKLNLGDEVEIEIKDAVLRTRGIIKHDQRLQERLKMAMSFPCW